MHPPATIGESAENAARDPVSPGSQDSCELNIGGCFVSLCVEKSRVEREVMGLIMGVVWPFFMV